jgi:hypothetical protein
MLSALNSTQLTELDEIPVVAIRTGEGGTVIIRANEVNQLCGAMIRGVLGLVEQLVQPTDEPQAIAPCSDCGGPLVGDSCQACLDQLELAEREHFAQLAERQDARYQVNVDNGGLVLRLNPAMQCLACGELASGGIALMSGKVVPLCGACAGRLAALYE